MWALIQSLVDDVWPDGDVAGLHAAAGRWRTFGTALCGMQDALNASKALVGAQQIPEGEKVIQVLSQIGGCANGIGAQCAKLACTLDDFADQVCHAQNDIRDLLHRLGSLADIGHDVALVFEGKALDELEEIAGDINNVLRDLGREARAAEQGMKLGMRAIDGWVVGMEKCMRGEFRHFLGDAVGNQVADMFDTWANFSEGSFKGLVGMVQGIEELDPRWLLLDPAGALNTWKGMTRTGLLNHFRNPQDALEADKQMFRSLLHLDDWRSDRPGLGAGENAFDVATLFLPGVGEAGAGVKGGAAGARGAGDGAEAADAAGAARRGGEFGAAAGELDEIGTAGGGFTKGLQDVTNEIPTAERPPVSGAPVALPATGKLPEAPVVSTPHAADPAAPGGAHDPAPPSAGDPHEPVPAGGPYAPGGGPPEPSVPSTPGERMPSTTPEATEPLPAGAHEQASPPAGASEPTPAPAEGPREPVPGPAEGPRGPVPASAEPAHDTTPAPVGATSTPMSAGLPGERPPWIDPHPAEPASARVPASPSASLGEPAPAAAHTPPPTAASPHASAPSSAPASGRPAELPSPHGGPREPSEGIPKGNRPPGPGPHGPHGPRDDGLPGKHPHERRPHEGNPHRPEHGGPSHGGGSGDNTLDPTHRLHSDDLSTFADYTGTGYIDLNEALRNEALDASLYARVEALNNALSKLPPYEGPVVRGTNLPSEVLAQYRPDEYIIEKGFMSTTRDPGVAQSPAFAGNVEFRIASFTGRDVSPYSMFPTEQEVLFPSHTRFLVISRQVDPLTGRTIIEMIEE
ncbi:ADP-ribosyltransferase [Mycobacterium parmense]